MKFTLKHSLSRRNFFILGIVFVVLTLFSIYILSSLITQISEKSNSTNSLRSFIKKQEVLALEFSRFLEVQKEITQIIEISTSNNLSDNLKVLSAIHANQNLVKNNWFQINDGKIEFSNSKKNTNLTAEINDFIAKSATINATTFPIINILV